jgi:hypothetical protein
MSRGRRKSARASQHRGSTPPRPAGTDARPATSLATAGASQPPAAAQPQPEAPLRNAAPEQKASPRQLRKDQERALTAYSWAEAARRDGKLDEYEIAVQSFAAALLRSGFAAAVSVLERSKERDGFKLLLDDLANRPLLGIAATSAADWPASVRALGDVTQYMQATRELMLLLGWLRRACRAIGSGVG